VLWSMQTLGPQSDGEWIPSVTCGINGGGPSAVVISKQAIGECCGVAMIAARADSCAASDGIPSRVSPFDARGGCHIRKYAEACSAVGLHAWGYAAARSGALWSCPTKTANEGVSESASRCTTTFTTLVSG
jgi:hypothetical protein